jgi:histidinol-phosphate/aromatic aminotransferase/cobyric acid decarboxylase-like protein
MLDLSVSLNPSAPDVASMVARHAESIRRYPDDTAARDALATAMAIEPERVVLTNGGAEAIALVASLVPMGDVQAPEFSLYEKHLTSLKAGAPRWRSNPNNPTGALARADEIAAVWDEAFFPLATGCWTRGDAGVIAVGSLTKVFACPGLRIGYVIAPTDEFARAIVERRPEWSVNSIACALLPELLEVVDLPKWARSIASQRTKLVTLLSSHQLEPVPSDANYVLVRHAPGLRTHLARRGVVVRDTASFGIADGVRIAVPDGAGLDRLSLALQGWER